MMKFILDRGARTREENATFNISIYRAKARGHLWMLVTSICTKLMLDFGDFACRIFVARRRGFGKSRGKD